MNLTREQSAAGFTRPLLLTAGQDLYGYIAKIVGRAALTLVTSLTILSVFLIFLFIIIKSSGFLFGLRGLHATGAGEARFDGFDWQDYSFRTKLMLEDGAVRLNTRRTADGGYFLDASKQALVLGKYLPGGRETILGEYTPPSGTDAALPAHQWHDIEIRELDGEILVTIGRSKPISVKDDAPARGGGVSIVTFAGSDVHVDQVTLAPEGWASASAGQAAAGQATDGRQPSGLLTFDFDDDLPDAWKLSGGWKVDVHTGGPMALFRDQEWYPTHAPPDFGALGMVFGSAIVTLGAVLVAGPAGILAAVFLSDILSFRFRQIIKPVIEILAAIPSVAYGFFAILVVAPWMQNTLGLSTGTNALNASVLLAVMAIPTVVSISEDSLSAIGREMREGGYALGGTRAEVLCKVIMPAAHSGIIAAVILGIMRAVGETMLVWMAAGNATAIPTPWWDLTSSVRTLTATIAAEMGEAPEGSIHRHSLFAIGLLLLGLTFVLNLVSEYFLARAKRIAKGTAK